MGFVISTIAPIFGLIGLGLTAARLGWLSATAGKGVTEFTFLIAMPALLFRTIVSADIGDAQPLLLLTSYFATIALTWLLAAWTAQVVLKTSAAEGAPFAMTASYGNIILLGIPIALSAYGERAAPTAAIIVSMHVATLWLAACVHLALAERAQTATPAAIARSALREFARNPIVMAIVIGGVWRLTGLELHSTVERALTLLTQASVPCALFAVGFSLAGFRVGGEFKTLIAAVTFKNVLLPPLAWIMTVHVFGVPVLAATVITLFAAMPTGAATYLFATQNNIAVQTTSATVAVSTGLSMFTLPIVLYVLGQP